MRERDIAAVIRRDLLREEIQPSTNIVACWSCGQTYRYKGRNGDTNGNFCSMRCQDWYDAGHARLESKKPPAMRISCLGCGKEFDSRGLRCCSVECERRYREREDNQKLMAEVGIAPAVKRHCECPGCAATIPKWRNGRRVSRATRFCSPKCARRAKTANAA